MKKLKLLLYKRSTKILSMLFCAKIIKVQQLKLGASAAVIRPFLKIIYFFFPLSCEHHTDTLNQKLVLGLVYGNVVVFYAKPRYYISEKV